MQIISFTIIQTVTKPSQPTYLPRYLIRIPATQDSQKNPNVLYHTFIKFFAEPLARCIETPLSVATRQSDEPTRRIIRPNEPCAASQMRLYSTQAKMRRRVAALSRKYKYPLAVIRESERKRTRIANFQSGV